MKIKLIVFSITGHTLSVIQRAEKVFNEAGHDAQIERIEVLDDQTASGRLQLTHSPDTADCDCLLFAGPVHAFSACPTMRQYLSRIKDLKGRPAVLLVTHQFPKPWMGGNRAIRQMKKLVITKNGRILSGHVIDWSNPAREDEIEAAILAIQSQVDALA